MRDRAHQLAAAIQAGLPAEVPAPRGGDDPEYEPDELSILSGRGRLVEAKASGSSSQGSPAGSPPLAAAAAAKAGAVAPQRIVEAYNATHPPGFDEVQTGAPAGYAGKMPWAMWSVGTAEGGSSGGEGSPGDVGLSVNARGECQGFGAELDGIGMAAQGYSVYSTPSSQGNAEEVGMTPGWESSWQGFLRQLDVMYE